MSSDVDKTESFVNMKYYYEANIKSKNFYIINTSYKNGAHSPRAWENE